MTVIPMTDSFDFVPQPSSIIFTSPDGGTTSRLIICEDSMEFDPDIKTCVSFLLDAIWNGGSKTGILLGSNSGPWTLSLGNFQLHWNVEQGTMAARWLGSELPPNFLAFQKEIERYLKLKAFW